MTPSSSFFSSPFWLDVRRALERAPLFVPGLRAQWVYDANVARRLLENRLVCVREASDQADQETQRRLRTLLAGLEIETVLAGLLETLKEAVLIVGASTGVGSAVGAGVGTLFGGVGAAPGAAIGASLGAQVGLWILGALGLVALAEFFLEGLPDILHSYYQGFSLAWRAGRDEVTDHHWNRPAQQSSQISVASDRIADGHVAMVVLLLSAIVDWLSRGRGSMQALAQQAGSGRLGPRFAQWMVKHEDRLRNHPALQPRQRKRLGAAGDGAGEPPPPPRPPRRDDREPGGPSRMPRKDVRCFSTSDLPKSKVPEFDRQLAGQEAGVNRMTVEEYLKGREAFKNGDMVRDPQLAQMAREDHRKALTAQLSQGLAEQGLGRDAALAQARKMADEQMETLAALHNPDLQAGGEDVIADFGDRKVNSRIGALWRAGKNSRLDELDEAARAIPTPDRGSALMNAKLQRCK